MEINITQQLLEVVKIAAIIFALIHFLSGIILTRQVSRMSKIIKTPRASIFALTTSIYLFLLILVLGFTILI